MKRITNVYFVSIFILKSLKATQNRPSPAQRLFCFEWRQSWICRSFFLFFCWHFSNATRTLQLCVPFRQWNKQTNHWLYVTHSLYTRLYANSISVPNTHKIDEFQKSQSMPKSKSHKTISVLCASNGNWKIRAHSSCSLGVAFNFYRVNKNKWFIRLAGEQHGKQVCRGRRCPWQQRVLRKIEEKPKKNRLKRMRPRESESKRERKRKRNASTRKSLIFYSFNFLRVRINVTIM